MARQPIVIFIAPAKGRAAILLYSELWENQGSLCSPRTGENDMHKTLSFASIALVAAIVAIWGTTGIVATSPNTAVANTSIDVMQMMRNARNLPEQQFDAH